VIPPLQQGWCQLWWASAAADRPPLLEMLDGHEHHRHSRFVRPLDRSLFAVAHALTRIVAGYHAGVRPRALAYAAPPRPGMKPHFTGPGSALEFSLSHSGSHVVLAVSRGVPLGVDLERVDGHGPEPSLLDAALSARELRALAATSAAEWPWAFSRYWSRKEAVLKATGDGLAISPKRIAVTAPGEEPALLGWAHARRPASMVHLYDLEPAGGYCAAPGTGGYCAALATLGAQLRRSDHDGDALLGASR
jgi:4'-phosphopantetheinyl transferase